MTWFRLLCVTLAMMVSTSARAQPQTPEPLRRLSILVGSWDVDDVYRPITGPEIREVGVRTCAYTLRDRYVECVTIGRNAASGREREYRWLINYDNERKRYDLVGVFSNYTGKARQTFHVDSTGSTWNIRQGSSVSDGVEQWSWAQLIFEGQDRAVWTSYRNLETDAHSRWTQATRETWVRRK